MKKRTLLLNGIILIMVFFCFYFSTITIQSFQQALKFIFKTILPSLFPFMIFINFILLGDCIDLLAKLCKPIGYIFHLSGYGMVCVIGSILGGFPYSAILATSFIKEKKISTEEGISILKFAFFPSISFLFSSLYPMNNLVSKEVLWVCISLYVSSFLCLFFNNIKRQYPNKEIVKKEVSFVNLYFDVMNKSLHSIVAIAFCVIFFTIIKGYLVLFISQKQIYFFLSGILEFSSTSCEILNQLSPSYIDLNLLCFILSFSSFSIFFQSAFYLKNVNISIKKLIIPRLLVCLGSLILFNAIYFLFKTFT